MTAKPKVRIDIVSDVVCPWCIVGYKRLEQALALLAEQVEAEIHWHPFELNPRMPEAGQNLREHLAEKYGTTVEGSVAARARLTAIGAELDFAFDFSDEMKMVNTFKAHQLLRFARERGMEQELKLRLFSAYFSEHKMIGDVDVLVSEAAAVGLDADEARAALEDERFASDVRAEEHGWMARGVRAVPTFVFNEKLGVSGAQEPKVLAQVMLEALAKDEEAAPAPSTP